MTVVRTKTKATGGITPEEKVKLGAVAQEWIGIAMRTESIEPDKIAPAIEGIYEAANLKKPRVVIAPSPLVMAFAYGAAAWIWYCRKQGGATIDATIDATRDAIIDATIDATIDAIIDATDTPEQQAALACLHLAGKGGIECAKRWGNIYQGGNMWAAWVSYLVGFRDVIGLDLPEHKAFKFYEEAAKHGGFRVMHEEFCIVSDFPEVLKKDEQNRPHCENGPSHKWRDGWSLYHWHGVRIPAEWIEDKVNLTAKIALTWENIEQRRAACEIMGWHRILEELQAVIIDEDGDPEIGTLLEVELPNSGKERFLKVQCGTGRIFALPVPPNIQTAIQAQAWTYGLDTHDFNRPEVRT
mgnify:CR=1 FL=1